MQQIITCGYYFDDLILGLFSIIGILRALITCIRIIVRRFGIGISDIVTCRVFDFVIVINGYITRVVIVFVRYEITVIVKPCGIIGDKNPDTSITTE